MVYTTVTPLITVATVVVRDVTPESTVPGQVVVYTVVNPFSMVVIVVKE